MRLLRLNFPDSLEKLDLHPLVSVIQGVSAAKQLQLFDSIRRIAAGSIEELYGLVEHEGLLVELDGLTNDMKWQGKTTQDVVAYLGVDSSSRNLEALKFEIESRNHENSVLLVALEEARADIDFSSKADVFRFKNRLDMATGSASYLQTLSTNDRRIDAVKRVYEVADSIHPTVSSMPDGVEQLQLDLRKYLKDKEAFEEKSVDLLVEIDTAKSIVLEAEQRMKQAEEDAKPAELSAEQERRLELLSDPESDSSRKGKWRKQLNEDEEIELKFLLDKVGVSSWTEYSLFRLSPEPTRAQKDLLLISAQNLSKAQDELAQLETELNQSDEKQRIDTELSRIMTESEKHLSFMIPPEGQLDEALGSLVKVSNNPQWLESVDKLRDVLGSNDLNPPNDLLPKEILEWTKSWLRAQTSLSEGETAEEENLSEEELTQQIFKAERRLTKHIRSMARIELLEKELAVLSATISDLQMTYTKASNAESFTKEQFEEYFGYLAAKVFQESGGSLPLVLVSDFAGFSPQDTKELLNWLEEIAQSVQVILVSDNREAIDWCQEVGFQRSMLITERTSIRS